MQSVFTTDPGPDANGGGYRQYVAVIERPDGNKQRASVHAHGAAEAWESFGINFPTAEGNKILTVTEQ